MKERLGENLDEKSIIKVFYVPAVLHASVRTLSMQYWNTRLHTFDGRQLYWYFLALFTIQYCLFMVDCQVIFNSEFLSKCEIAKDIFGGRWWHLMQLFYFVLVKYMCNISLACLGLCRFVYLNLLFITLRFFLSTFSNFVLGAFSQKFSAVSYIINLEHALSNILYHKLSWHSSNL